MFDTVNPDTIDALRGSEDWDYGEAECSQCGAPHPFAASKAEAAVVRTLLTSKAIYFETARPCKASIQRGAAMGPCGSRRWKIAIHGDEGT